MRQDFYCYRIPVTHETYQDLHKLDETYVGTSKYMGLKYFWAYEYRHWLRCATPRQCKLVHDAFLKANLPLSGESKEHLRIIKRFIKQMK